MSLALRPLRVIELVDRRVLGAFRLTDAATGLPITTAATVETRRATLTGSTEDLALAPGAVGIQQNRSGVYVLLSAPLFETYTVTFADPRVPAEAAGGPLQLHLAVTEAGAQFLPRAFQIDLPRSLSRTAADTVFEPQDVSLFRAPGASAQEGWTVLRVTVTRAGSATGDRLPGVLVRVFRSPRSNGDAPIAVGMTDWRGSVRGEALVPLVSIQRFRPGTDATVVVRDQTIEFDTTRDESFAGATGEVPDVARLSGGTGSGLIRVSNQPPNPQLVILRPASPVRVQAGREYVVNLAMP